MTDQIPRRNFLPGRLLGRLLLSLTGWQIESDLPQLPKCVIVVAPHTSNWDFFFGMSAALTLDLDACWFGKHTLFRYRPVSWILTRLGGIPVDRNHPRGAIEQIMETCKTRDKFLFAIAPEGTRRRVTRWKPGAYHIAHNTGIPIVPVQIDHPHKKINFLQPFRPGKDMEQEMLKISSFFSAAQAKNPQNFSPHQAKVKISRPADGGDC